MKYSFTLVFMLLLCSGSTPRGLFLTQVSAAKRQFKKDYTFTPPAPVERKLSVTSVGPMSNTFLTNSYSYPRVDRYLKPMPPRNLLDALEPSPVKPKQALLEKNQAQKKDFFKMAQKNIRALPTKKNLIPVPKTFAVRKPVKKQVVKKNQQTTGFSIPQQRKALKLSQTSKNKAELKKAVFGKNITRVRKNKSKALKFKNFNTQKKVRTNVQKTQVAFRPNLQKAFVPKRSQTPFAPLMNRTGPIKVRPTTVPFQKNNRKQTQKHFKPQSFKLNTMNKKSQFSSHRVMKVEPKKPVKAETKAIPPVDKPRKAIDSIGKTQSKQSKPIQNAPEKKKDKKTSRTTPQVKAKKLKEAPAVALTTQTDSSNLKQKKPAKERNLLDLPSQNEFYSSLLSSYPYSI